ncbi:MAG: hypothetical protein EU541_04390 [Promethearchaeota archaeon]|nr:MAG: hypothetical protein EU541_04390 [Candidatus Lokiarchaeota archaeon]
MSTDTSSVNKGGEIDLVAEMDDDSYLDFNAYVSYYSYGFHNTEETLNNTKLLSNSGFLDYTYEQSYNIPSEPSGYGIFYVIPEESDYITPNSPREIFEITNAEPIIFESSSYVGSKQFSDTQQGDNLLAQYATQGDSINFRVKAEDQGTYGDTNPQLTVSVSFFMVVLSEEIDGTSSILLMYPSEFATSELSYNNGTEKYEGSITIPHTMLFSSIKGNTLISTESSPNQNDIDYLSLLYINVLDSDGTATEDPFFILYYVNPAPDSIPWPLIIIILVGIGGFIGVAVLIYALRKDKIHPEGETVYEKEPTMESSSWEEKQSYSSEYNSKAFHCPYCGRAIETPKRYCPGCGKSIDM